jgi:hypothetical protein
MLYGYHDKGRVEALLRRSPHDLHVRLTKLNEVGAACVLCDSHTSAKLGKGRSHECHASRTLLGEDLL